MFALAPLEVLGLIFLLYVTLRVFRWALRSRKVEKAIEEVTHPEHHSVDGVLTDFNYAKDKAANTVNETDAEIARKHAKNERLRKAYGG
jgi:hypothetical protein